MEKIYKRKLIPAIFLSTILPGLGLLYTRRCGLALGIALLFFFITLLFKLTPLFFYSTSFFLCITALFLTWLTGIIVSIYSARKGVFYSDLLEDQGYWFLAYTFFILLSFIFLNGTSAYVYRINENFEEYVPGDYFIIQPVPENYTSSDFQHNEYLLVRDSNNQERMAKVIALPGDILEEEAGGTLRNGKPLPTELKLPFSPWIVPDNLIFIDSPVTLELVNLAVLRTAAGSGAALLPFDRISARLRFCLFSRSSGFAQSLMVE